MGKVKQISCIITLPSKVGILILFVHDIFIRQIIINDSWLQ